MSEQGPTRNPDARPSARKVAHLLAGSQGGIRQHVRYLAAHPPPGYRTAGVWGPSSLEDFFAGLDFRATGHLGRLRVRDADVVHAHGLTAGAVALRPRRPPVVITLHMDVDTQGRTAASPVLRKLAPLIASRADALIAVSERVASVFPAARVIPPAVEPLPPARRTREEVRRELGTPLDRVVVVSVARLHADKGLEGFVDAVAAAGAEGWICGDGPLRSALEDRVRGTGVRLLGYRGDIAEVLGAADVFALASVGEGYGIAVVEAMTAGLPVIASRAGAMPEIVGEAGMLVDPGDVEGLRSAIGTLVADERARARLAAMSRARRAPEPTELVGRIREVYEEVTG